MLCACFLVVFAAIAVAHGDIASKRWDKTLLTPDSSDLVSSVALGGNAANGSEYAIVAGCVRAHRGHNVSLQAIVATSEKSPGVEDSSYDASTKYTDAFVIRVASPNGTVEWAHRLGGAPGPNGVAKSRYYDVALDEERNRVYAVGHQKNLETRAYDALLTITDSKTGEFISTMRYSSSGPGNAGFAAVVQAGDAIYMCGSDSSKEQSGSHGVRVVKASLDGSEIWSKKLGRDRIRDRCKGIAVRGDVRKVLVTAMVHEETSSTRSRGISPLPQAAVFSLDDATGATIWETLLPRSFQVQDIPSGVAADENGVYVSSTKWINPMWGKRIFLSKLAISNGIPLWSRDVCCGELIPSLKDVQQYEGKGSAEASRGLSIGTDGHVYIHGYYRNKRESTSEKYATIVTRTSIFGSHDGRRDVSSPIESFQFESQKPLMMATSSDKLALAVVERVGDLTSTDEMANNVRVVSVNMRPVSARNGAHYMSTSGLYYSLYRVKLSPSSDANVTLDAIKTVFAELAHASPHQVSVAVDSRDELIQVTLTVFHDNPPGPEESTTEVAKLLANAVSPSIGSRKSPLQESLGVTEDILVKETRIERIAFGESSKLAGATQSMGFGAGDMSVGAAGEIDESRGESSRGSKTDGSEGGGGGCIELRLLPQACQKVHTVPVSAGVLCASGYSDEEKEEVCMTPSHIVLFDGRQMTASELCIADGIQCRQQIMLVNSCVAFTRENIRVSSRLQLTHFSTSWRRMQVLAHLLLVGARAIANVTYLSRAGTLAAAVVFGSRAMSVVR